MLFRRGRRNCRHCQRTRFRWFASRQTLHYRRRIESMPVTRVGAIVLAAGSARRFGSQKLTQQLAGKPLLTRVIEAALNTDIEELVVVVRPNDEEVFAVVPEDPRVKVRENANHESGMSSSLSCGLRSLDSSIEAALILLADEPEISPDQIAAVVAGFASPNVRAVRASYGGRPGHPVLLGRQLWPDVLLERGDIGARRVLERSPGVVVVQLERDRPVDVDTEEDLASLRKRSSRM